MSSSEKQPIEKKTRALREILSKYCSYLVINQLLRLTDGGQSKISEEAGKERNALTKNLSEIEEITLPTFLRYWEASQTISGKELPLDSIYNEEIRKTVQMINLSKDIKEFDEFITDEKRYFSSPVFLHLIKEKRKFLSKDQQAVAEDIIRVLRGGEKNE